MKKLLLLITIIIEFFGLSMWFKCVDFKDFLNLSSINIPLHLEDLSNLDKGISLFIIRIFHNKFEDYFIALLKRYLWFWDIRFGIPFFSIIGYFGIFSAFYYLLIQKNKRWYTWLILIILLGIPFIQILKEPHINFTLKIILYTFPYFIFSLYGIWKFIQPNLKSRNVTVIILLLLSIWWIFGMGSEIARFCIK